MTLNFGVQKEPIFGTYGEFTVGSDGDRVRAQFLLTKMKPGSDGDWENWLASQMVPWREIFKIEELTFDELLQRDLDDSRVAHDLIPYLLGESGAFARFFPPILAVLVPNKPERSGILPYYPIPENQSDTLISFGDLFDFEKAVIQGEISPLGLIKYNRQQTAFIIVDGQHRAMALLALHRQINDSWQGNRYAAYYNHLSLTENQVKNIELPICIVFFPDLHEGNQKYKERGIDLKTVCREIFLVVNKTAKRVSQSRELLLDDEDFAARMMRETLSKLKGRGEETASLARIYSFAFGDSISEAQNRKAEVVAGQLEYSSAVVLHKMHAAVAFGVPAAFNLEQPQDITDGRRVLNSERPASILIGTSLQKWATLSRRSGKYHPPHEVQEAVQYLAGITDEVILSLFDQFHPFAVHNREMRALRTRLQDPALRGDPIQTKCYSLLFEGSGVRTVFEEHINRLKDRKVSLEDEGKTIGDYILNQLSDAQATSTQVNRYEDGIKKRRSCKLFNINYDKFFASEENLEEQKELLNRSKWIYDTVSTQAFQLGYLMAIHSVVELFMKPDSIYEDRLTIVKFISNLYINALNQYFSSDSDTEHRTLTGFVKESRIKVFDPNELGLRGLLAQSVKELNESQWIFFRYAILEIVHSKYSYKALVSVLENQENSSLSQKYREVLPELVNSFLNLREEYIQKSVDSGLNAKDFSQEILLLKARLKGEGKSDEEIDAQEKEKRNQTEQEIRDKCKENISASLGEFIKADKIINRISQQLSVEDIDSESPNL
jgi:DNA-sulfur modification-associated